MKRIVGSAMLIFWALSSLLLGTDVRAQTELAIVRGDENYPPFEMVVNGRLTGLHVEMVEAAAHLMGAKVNWKSLPWKRALLMVESGQADGVTYIGRTAERETWAIFDEDNRLSAAEVRFAVRSESADTVIYNGDLASFMKGRTPIVVRGFQFGTPEIDAIKRIEADNMHDVVRMLNAKMSDVAVLNWSDFYGEYGHSPQFNTIVALSPPIKINPSYIAFSAAKKDGDLAKRFGTAMRAFKKTPAYTKLLKRYRVGP